MYLNSWWKTEGADTADFRWYYALLTSNEVCLNPLFFPHQKCWVLEGNESPTASKGSKTARDVHMQISSLHLLRYPTSSYSNHQPNGSILRTSHFTTTSALPLAPIECRTGILIRLNHNSHSNKNIPRQKHNAPLSRMLCWTEKVTVKRKK